MACPGESTRNRANQQLPSCLTKAGKTHLTVVLEKRPPLQISSSPGRDTLHREIWKSLCDSHHYQDALHSRPIFQLPYGMALGSEAQPGTKWPNTRVCENKQGQSSRGKPGGSAVESMAKQLPVKCPLMLPRPLAYMRPASACSLNPKVTSKGQVGLRGTNQPSPPPQSQPQSRQGVPVIVLFEFRQAAVASPHCCVLPSVRLLFLLPAAAS